MLIAVGCVGRNIPPIHDAADLSAIGVPVDNIDDLLLPRGYLVLGCLNLSGVNACQIRLTVHNRQI